MLEFLPHMDNQPASWPNTDHYIDSHLSWKSKKALHAMPTARNCLISALLVQPGIFFILRPYEHVCEGLKSKNKLTGFL